MSLDVTEHFELPLPHPDNSPRTVDVPRLRAALTAIDELLKELQDQAEDLDEGKADKSQVAIDIANAVSAAVSDLLNGAPEAYDTLKEIADKLADNDDVAGNILLLISALQSGKADLVSGKVPLAQLPVASNEDAAAGTGDGLMKAAQVGGHVDAKIVAAIDDLRHVEYTAKFPIATGDPVVQLSDGRVMNSDVSVASIGTPSDLGSNNGSFVAACYDPANDVYVVFWRDDSSGSGKAAICTVDGDAVTVGSASTFSSSSLTANASNGLSACYDSARNQIIVAYMVGSQARMRTCQVSDGALTFGAELAVGSSGTATVGVCYDKSIDRALLTYVRSAALHAAVVAISGSALTLGDTQQIISSNVNDYACCVVHCDGHSSPGMNLCVFRYSSSASVRLLKIDPDTFELDYSVYNTVAYLGTVAGRCLAWNSQAMRAYIFGGGTSGNSGTYRYTRYSVTTAAITLDGSAVDVDIDGITGGDIYRCFPAISSYDNGDAIAFAWSDRGSSSYGKLAFTNLITSNSTTLQTAIQYHTAAVGWVDLAFSDDGSSGLLAFAPGPTQNTGVPKVAAIVPPRFNRLTSFVGFAANDADAGEVVKVIPPFGIDRSRTGLVPGAKYSLGGGGKLTVSSSAPRVGFALSETELLVLGSNNYQV